MYTCMCTYYSHMHMVSVGQVTKQTDAHIEKLLLAASMLVSFFLLVSLSVKVKGVEMIVLMFMLGGIHLAAKSSEFDLKATVSTAMAMDS